MKKIALIFALVCLAGPVLAQTTPAQPAPSQTPLPATIPGTQVPPPTDPAQLPAGGHSGSGNKHDGIQGRDSAGTFEQRMPGQTTVPAPTTPANRTRLPKNRPSRRDSLR